MAQNGSKTGFSKPNFDEILTFPLCIPLYFHSKPFICTQGKKSNRNRPNIVFLEKGHFGPKNGSKPGFSKSIFDQKSIFWFYLSFFSRFKVLTSTDLKKPDSIRLSFIFPKNGTFFVQNDTKTLFLTQTCLQKLYFCIIHLFSKLFAKNPTKIGYFLENSL